MEGNGQQRNVERRQLEKSLERKSEIRQCLEILITKLEVFKAIRDLFSNRIQKGFDQQRAGQYCNSAGEAQTCCEPKREMVGRTALSTFIKYTR